MVKTVGLSDYSDIHFTNTRLAGAIIEHFSPQGLCLEPFRGGGAFYDHLPRGSEWCEIEQGRDFFEYTQPVDWIITNPPFSSMTRVFEHAFTLADNCVFLIPISKYWSSASRLQAARSFGGLAKILHVGTGRQVGFNTGFPFGALHFKRGYQGAIAQVQLDGQFSA